MKKSEIKVIAIDLFAGAGGVTTGMLMDPRVKVIACVNHDENAIKSHEANHPDCIHLTEDVRSVSMEKLKAIVDEARKIYPNAKLWVHASLECQNFSLGKKGDKKDNSSRTLAEDMPRYEAYLKPDLFTIENVKQFMDYGPLDANDRVIKSLKGTWYKAWVEKMKSLNDGYYFDYKILSSADYGGYTFRKRFFGVFSAKKSWIQWPVQTHFKNKNHKQVREILSLGETGKSIFNRKKDLCDNTLNRILNGLKNYQDQFYVTYYSSGKNHYPIDKPMVTLTTKDRASLISPVPFIYRDYTNGYHSAITEPIGSLLTNPKANLITPVFLTNPQWGSSKGMSIYKPCFTLIARMDKAPPQIVQATLGEIHIKETDSPKMVELKTYMKEKGLGDVLYRPLFIKEMLKIQGFPEGYKLIGTDTEKKKFIGNSVETTVMFKWTEAIINSF